MNYSSFDVFLQWFKNAKTMLSWGAEFGPQDVVCWHLSQKTENYFQGDEIASCAKEMSFAGDRLNSLAIFVWQCPTGNTLLTLDV